MIGEGFARVRLGCGPRPGEGERDGLTSLDLEGVLVAFAEDKPEPKFTFFGIGGVMWAMASSNTSFIFCINSASQRVLFRYCAWFRIFYEEVFAFLFWKHSCFL